MGKPELSKTIMGTMGTWGGNYNSNVGCSHDTGSDKVDQKIDSKEVTLNKMSQMDASHAKPGSMNPGVDKGFLGKANPVMDTTGHGKLTRNCKD